MTEANLGCQNSKWLLMANTNWNNALWWILQTRKHLNIGFLLLQGIRKKLSATKSMVKKHSADKIMKTNKGTEIRIVGILDASIFSCFYPRLFLAPVKSVARRRLCLVVCFQSWKNLIIFTCSAYKRGGKK